jgi:uncharacterized protein (DUF1697 family)
MSAERQAVLLRGVNVGKAKRIAMSDYAAILADLGASDVRTVLNSGNAVCTSRAAPEHLAASVSAAIEERLGFRCDVVARTRAEVEALVARDPLGTVATDPSRYLVTFLATVPSAEAVAALSALDVTPDEWVLEGRELYCWLPTGVAESPLTKQLGRGVLGVPWTGRSWTTVTRLRDLL